MKKIFFLLAFFIFFAQAVFAQTVFTSDQYGNLKRNFTTTDTVFIGPTETNITTNSSVAVWIVNDSNSWANQTNLTDVRGSYTNISVNGSGFIDGPHAIWSLPNIVGNYDMVVDANQNGVYDYGTDYVFDLNVTGFQVIAPQVPTLLAVVGENNTSNYNYTIPSNTSDLVMLQLKLTTGNIEGVNLNSLSLIASGSGDDSTGVGAVKLYAVLNGSGIFDSSATLLGFAQYVHDNGAAVISITTPAAGYTIPANTTAYFLIVYSMKNNSLNGDTYAFYLASISATGTTSGNAAAVSGLPINSAVTTVFVAGETTTTTTSSSSSTTEVTTSSTTSKGLFANSANYFWIYVAGGVSAFILAMFVFLYYRAARPYQYEFKPQA